MPIIAPRMSGVARADATQWSSDPTAELDFDQFLGLCDAPERPTLPRARMTLFRDGSRTVAITEGWRSYPPIVDLLPGPSTPSNLPKKSRNSRNAPPPRPREIVSASTPAVPSCVEGEELLTTQAAAAYCGYLDGVSIRKAKFDDLLAPVRIGKNRSYLWRRSDLDAHNRRRGFVPSDAQSVAGGVTLVGDIAAENPIGPTGAPASAASASLPVDSYPEVTAPVVDPIDVSVAVPCTPADVPTEVLASAERHLPTSTFLAPVESDPVASGPLTDGSDPSTSTSTLDPAIHEEHTAADGSAAVMPPAWRRRPLAAVVQLVLPWEILAALSDSSGSGSSPETAARLVIPTARFKCAVPYRGALLARRRLRASD